MHSFACIFFICGVIWRTDGVMLSWNDKRTNFTNAILIPFPHLSLLDSKVPLVPDILGKMLDEKKNLSRFSLDEKCENGLPLSIAWYPNQPYAGNQAVGYNVAVFGMFPDIFKIILRSCCKPGTKVSYGLMSKSFSQLQKSFRRNDISDFTFPVYGEDMKSKTALGLPFVPVIRCPKAVLLTFYNYSDLNKSTILLMTLVGAWPLVIFILLAALCSGIIMYLLEFIGGKRENSSFFGGMWQGFWWAFVTMTTVGYGDHTPKTFPARLFCTMWIILGICGISLLTGMITAVLYVKSQRYFNINGATIGAVNGSEEFKLGVSLFAKMKAYDSPAKLFGFLKSGELDGMLIDHYAYNRFATVIEGDKAEDDSLKNIHVEKLIDHGITYGLSLATNSTRTERCFRTFLQDNQQVLFEVISRYLKPIKRSGDSKTYVMHATEALFYQEKVFITLMNVGVGLVCSGFVIGIIWEYCYRRHKDRFTSCCKRKTSGYQAVQTDDINMIVFNDRNRNACAAHTNVTSDRKEALAEELEEFQSEWINKLENIEDLDDQFAAEEMVVRRRFDIETTV